jgi:retron-type reverse transcriptase
MKPATFLALTPDRVSEATGLPVARLFKLARQIEPYYRKTREKETRPGKFRQIDQPKPWLMSILRKLHRLLQASDLFHDAAHGGIRGRSCFSAARRHLGTKAVAIRDISDCFPSISTDQLRKKLITLGFRSDTAFLLAGLLTCNGRIPQGSPTSNDALNLFLYDVDETITRTCGPASRYTRTADDHVISGKTVDQVEQLASLLERAIEKNGLAINEKKKIEKGLTVAPNPQLVHAIAVNHPAKTRINREYDDKFIKLGHKYVRVARAVSAISLVAVATIRRQLLGYISYSTQADLSRLIDLRRCLRRGDRYVQNRLGAVGVTRSRKWWVKHKKRDRPAELSLRWRLLESRGRKLARS